MISGFEIFNTFKIKINYLLYIMQPAGINDSKISEVKYLLIKVWIRLFISLKI